MRQISQPHINYLYKIGEPRLPTELGVYLVAHYHTGTTATPDSWWQYVDDAGLQRMLNTVRGPVTVDWYHCSIMM